MARDDSFSIAVDDRRFMVCSLVRLIVDRSIDQSSSLFVCVEVCGVLLVSGRPLSLKKASRASVNEMRTPPSHRFLRENKKFKVLIPLRLCRYVCT